MENLHGKVAVVTGAASGIGKAVATRAAGEGMKVVLADIEENALKEATDELAADGADVLAAVTDVSDVASVRELRDRAVREFGAVHLVHNNAGVGTGGPIWDVPEKDWRWVLGVNLWGVVHGISTFVPLFLEQGEGHVVNTASIAGLTTAPFLGPYNAAKQAVVAMSETLYKDLEASGVPGVGVSVLCPGFVQTRIGESDRNRPSWAPGRDAEEAEEMRGLIKDLVSGGIPPEQVAELVLDAVRTNTFYILTHPELRGALQTRFDDILEGRAPSATIIA
ncbi:MAG TPA: SDR family NAD(P)-dependent oxidoreductase [Acidimicrobiales bacterium]|jgi:NAD(P)-dependent dehydrogenase (short-subunit alcohol dehydrogenase family)|nr:SDR family NAD(P)-dependent oxidoreductase [Acidimicrobiales bacterium]